MANGSQTSSPAKMYFLMFMGVHAGQWQAQDGAHALAEAAGVSVLAGASATAVEVESAPAAGAAGVPPLLKSVAYQPDPLS
jgi:hypothetical protein